MNKLTFNLDLDVTLFTGEGNFKVDKDGNPWDITYLVRGDVKRYENASVNKPCSVRIIKKISRSFLFDLDKRNIWSFVFNNYVPYISHYNYKDPVTYGKIAVYHEMNPVGITDSLIWLLRSQAKRVLEGTWVHRAGIN